MALAIRGHWIISRFHRIPRAHRRADEFRRCQGMGEGAVDLRSLMPPSELAYLRLATQAVVWIPGRNDTLLAAFLLLAVLAYRLDPGVSADYDNLGIAYGRQGLLREATGEFRAAMALDSADALPYNNMGYAEYLLGDHDAAERLWKRALGHDSVFVEPATKLALLYKSEGRWDEARVYARRLRRQGATLDLELVRWAEEAHSTKAMRR